MYSLVSRNRTKILVTLLPILIISLLTLSSLIKPPELYNENHGQIHILKHIQIAHSVCEGTLYPELCVSTISKFPNLLYSKSIPEIISATVNHTVIEVRASSSNCTVIRENLPKLSILDKRALDDCLELFDDTVSELRKAISDLSTKKSASKNYNDLQSLFSGAMTNQYTCLDGFAYSKANVRDYIERGLCKISHHVSNSLAMLKKIPGANSSEVFPEYYGGGFPKWVSGSDRRLLQMAVNGTRFDLVVAKDGSGNFTTIGEAVGAAPNSSATRFVIYVKAGAYFENVEVDRRKTRLMLVGDGIGKTVVKANRNVVDGWTTFRSATVDLIGVWHGWSGCCMYPGDGVPIFLLHRVLPVEGSYRLKRALRLISVTLLSV